MTVKSENFKVQAGTVKGDVYVEANGFTLTEVQPLMETFTMQVKM